MNQTGVFSADHNGFFHELSAFYPLIEEKNSVYSHWSNTALIRLPAALNEDLDWSSQLRLAEEVVKAGKFLFWELDLNLHCFQFTPEDSASFYSFSLAVEEFAKRIWSAFHAHTFGVALYRGQFLPEHSFPLERWERAYSEWKEGSIEQSYALFCAQGLAEYLHRLVSFLPDSALPFALIDISSIASPAETSLLFSKTRFEHVNLALKGAKAPFSGICWDNGWGAQGWMGTAAPLSDFAPTPSVGICLPNDAQMSCAAMATLDRLIVHLYQNKVQFRVIPEDKLTEQWDGLDRLIVLSEALSVQGKRKLLGFIAAGGAIATVGKPLGVPSEEIITQLVP